MDAVQVKEAENQEVYLTFSPRFEHIWLESKKRLLEFAAQKSAASSKYAIRLYAWAKKYVAGAIGALASRCADFHDQRSTGIERKTYRLRTPADPTSLALTR